MKKLKLFGIKRDKERAEFIIEKSQKFIPFIQKLIKEVTGKADWYLFIGTDEKTGECVDEKINNYTDRCKYKKYKSYELDIFVGKNRIVLIIRSSLKNQKRFTDKLMKFCKWKKNIKLRK